MTGTVADLMEAKINSSDKFAYIIIIYYFGVQCLVCVCVCVCLSVCLSVHPSVCVFPQH